MNDETIPKIQIDVQYKSDKQNPNYRYLNPTNVNLEELIKKIQEIHLEAHNSYYKHEEINSRLLRYKTSQQEDSFEVLLTFEHSRRGGYVKLSDDPEEILMIYQPQFTHIKIRGHINEYESLKTRIDSLNLIFREES